MSEKENENENSTIKFLIHIFIVIFSILNCIF